MNTLMASSEDGTEHGNLDGLLDIMLPGQEYGTILGYSVIV